MHDHAIRRTGWAKFILLSYFVLQNVLIQLSIYILVDCGASCTDLFQVALHEIGHNLGLEHSNERKSIMYPYLLDGNDALDTDDIAGIQALYGRPQTYPDPTTTPTYPTSMQICS